MRRPVLLPVLLAGALLWLTTAVAGAQSLPTRSASGSAAPAAPAAPAVQQATKAAQPAVQQAAKAAQPAVQQPTKAAQPAVQQATTAAQPAVQQATKAAQPAVQQATTAAQPAVQQATAAAQPAVRQASQAAQPAVKQASKAAEPVKAVASSAQQAVAEAAANVPLPAVPEVPAVPELPATDLHAVVDELVDEAESLPEQVLEIVEEIVPVPELPSAAELPVAPAVPQLPRLPVLPAAPEVPIISAPPEMSTEPEAVVEAEPVAQAETGVEITQPELAHEQPLTAITPAEMLTRAEAAGLVPSVAEGAVAAVVQTPVAEWVMIEAMPASAVAAVSSHTVEVPSVVVTLASRPPTADVASYAAPHGALAQHATITFTRASTPPATPWPTTTTSLPEAAGLSTSGNIVPGAAHASATALPGRGELLLSDSWRSLSRQPSLRPPELVLGNLAPPG
jgi:hypothetical protein